MTKEFLAKVKYLCTKIPDVEWSGILLYSIQGSVKDLDNFSVQPEDILPMNMGSAAYTEYEYDERYVEFMMAKPERMDMHIGHIHSHNHMGTFFSGTDISELNTDAKAHNFYLSVIVNNALDVVAKLCIEATTEAIPTDFKARDENGEFYTIESSVPEKRVKRFTYDCDIIREELEETPLTEFEKNVARIIEDKKKEDARKITPSYNGGYYPTSSYYNSTPVTSYNKNSWQKDFKNKSTPSSVGTKVGYQASTYEKDRFAEDTDNKQVYKDDNIFSQEAASRADTTEAFKECIEGTFRGLYQNVPKTKTIAESFRILSSYWERNVYARKNCVNIFIGLLNEKYEDLCPENSDVSFLDLDFFTELISVSDEHNPAQKTLSAALIEELNNY